MELQNFIDKYYKKSVGAPSGYVGECVSLLHTYLSEVYGLPYRSRGNAIKWENSLVSAGEAYKVDLPQRGDIIVWGEELNKWGHVAIYINEKLIFDQNNWSVAPTRVAQMRPMIKTKVATYLRVGKKEEPVISDEKNEEEVVIDSSKKQTTTSRPKIGSIIKLPQ